MVARILHAARPLGDGLRTLVSILYGLYAAVVMLFMIFGVLGIVVMLLPGLERRRRAAGALIRTALLLCGLPLRVTGLQRLPAGPCMVAANHASYLDGLLLTAALPPRFSYIVKDDVAGWPWVGSVLQRLGVVFIPRAETRGAARTMRALLRRLRAGESLGIFPEGTFRGDAILLPFKQGGFLLAMRSGVPVVPVAIHGSRTFYGEGARLPRWSPMRVEVLAPHAPEGSAEALSAAVRADMEAVLSA